MAYTKKVWKDAPDTSTPINAANLNHMEDGIAEADVNAQNALDRLDDVDDEITQINSDLKEKDVDSSMTWSAPEFQRSVYRVGNLVYVYIYGYCVTNFDGRLLTITNPEDKPVSQIKGSMVATVDGSVVYGYCVADVNEGSIKQGITSTPSRITQFSAQMVYYVN